VGSTGYVGYSYRNHQCSWVGKVEPCSGEHWAGYRKGSGAKRTDGMFVTGDSLLGYLVHQHPFPLHLNQNTNIPFNRE
jgi:hypothetical protein